MTIAAVVFRGLPVCLAGVVNLLTFSINSQGKHGISHHFDDLAFIKPQLGIFTTILAS
ncbi:hypothetical protein Lmor_1638 [Legionella moravica]|uniref:Uncharacterized protein n=1 Tax=Legionella moravica TaxID=39962 RepID=A0A378JW50_9GAMM|nr:hypothetical protein Lmor_1638 [Legionella moravica]STX62883.1 Uncharacterised protein [Legionella moravica]